MAVGQYTDPARGRAGGAAGGDQSFHRSGNAAEAGDDDGDRGRAGGAAADGRRAGAAGGSDRAVRHRRARRIHVLGTSDGIATSLGLTNKAQLPDNGLGLDVGAHVYPLRGRVVSLGVGASLLFVRATKKPTSPKARSRIPTDPTVRTRIKGFSPQVSLNFGSRRGYSYVSAGIGTMTRAIDDTEGVLLAAATGDTRARTLNYGGGARWFAGSRLAFTFDLRFYRVAAQDATASSVSLPQQRFFVGSAGISIH